MRIRLTSIMVEHQGNALRFYTEVLGFRKKHDTPVGEYRWVSTPQIRAFTAQARLPYHLGTGKPLLK